MNRWTPLEYAASAIVLVLVLAFCAVLDSSWKVGKALRRQSWLVIGLPLQLVMIALGLMASLGARLGVLVAGAAGVMIYLWSKDLGDAVLGLRDRGRYYLGIRAYRAGHRRGMAS